MTQTTDTPAVSGLRVLDVAHTITSELGEWQYHPGLATDTYNDMVGRPQVNFHLIASKATTGEIAEFLDGLAVVLGTVVHVSKHWIGSATVTDFRGTGVSVYGNGRIVEVAA